MRPRATAGDRVEWEERARPGPGPARNARGDVVWEIRGAREGGSLPRAPRSSPLPLPYPISQRYPEETPAANATVPGVESTTR